MPNPNTTLTDEIIRHAVYLGRYTKREIAEMLQILEGANGGLILEVMRGTDRADQARLLARIDALYGPAMKQVAEKLTADMKELAAYELERATKLADKIGIAFNMPAPTKVFETIMATPADAGTPMEVMFRRFNQNTRDRIAAVVRQNIVEGKGPAAMVKALRGETVKPARWIIQDGKRVLRPGVYKGGVYETTTRGAEALARTVTMHTYNTANAEVYRENADLLSSVKWCATLDMDTCEDCAALDGQEWPLDEDHPEPPLHPNCLLGDTLISSSSRIAAISKREYNGDLLVISTASGLEIGCTPNHPILSDAGFIPAQSLYLGQNIIRDAGIDRVSLCGENKDDMVSSIEELARSFLESGKMTARKVPLTAEDFHNDAVDNEIAIIFSDRELLKKTNPALSELGGEGRLIRRAGNRSALVPSLRPLDKFFLGSLYSLDRLVCGIGQSLTIFWTRALHALDLLLTSASCLNPCISEGAYQNLPGYANFFSNPGNTNAGFKKPYGFRKNTRNINAAIKLDASFAQNSIDDAFADAILSSHILAGHFGPVVTDKIIDIRKIKFSGHVYNLQTLKGFYIANGIITHNCRCVLVPRVKGFEASDSPRYEDWLASQSEERQNDILGIGRAEIFRSGEKLSDMSDGGRMLTLSELKAKDEA